MCAFAAVEPGFMAYSQMRRTLNRAVDFIFGRILLLSAVFCVMAIIVNAFSQSARGKTSPLPESDKIVIYIIEGMTFESVFENTRKFPALWRLWNAENTAVGVMNATGPRLLDVYLTLGAGSAVRTRSGAAAITPGGRGGAVFRGIHNLNKDDGSRHAEPGLLGDLLKRNGIRACLIDSGSEPLLPVLMLMDKNGRVPRVAAGKEMMNKTNSGMRSNHGAMMSAFESMYAECGLIAVRHGDMARAIKKHGENSGDAAQALVRADKLLNDLQSTIDKNTSLIVMGLPVDGHLITPANGRLLTSVIIHGPGVRAWGITTDTTRFPYLCTAIDIMPSIMQMFGHKAPDRITGRAVYFRHHRDGPMKVLDVNKRAVATDRFLYPGQIANSVFYLVMIFLSAVSLKRSAHGAPARGLHVSIRIISLALMLFPVVCIAFSPIMSNGMGIAANLVISLGMSFAGAVLLYAIFRGGSRAVIAALGITAVLIFADLAFGWGLNRSTIFGFSPILGKRFYGLGNESMAVVVGALVMGVPVLVDSMGTRGRAASFMACALMLPGIFFIGLPTLGANVGGTITAAVASVAVVFGVTGRRMTPARVLLMIPACILFVGLFLIVDWHQGAGRGTHMAHSIMQAHASSASVFADILARKLKIQLFVLFSTVYGYCLAVMFGIVMWSYHRGGSRLHALLESRPMLRAGAGAAMWAAAAGFLFNDSGLPIAALILGFLASVVCYFIPEFENDLKH